MAKYKYEVYEVVEEYQTFGIESGQIRQISVVRGQVQVYEFNNKNGTYSELSVDSKNTRSYYYKIDNEYFRFTEAVRWIGGSKQYYGAILEKVEVRKEKVNGNLIETITAEENEYPSNGIRDGKWYVRKEIIQERKISVKDSSGKLINITSIYFKDSNSNITSIGKAYSDEELVWAKVRNIKTINFKSIGAIAQTNKFILVPDFALNELIGKKIINIKIGMFGPFNCELKKNMFTRKFQLVLEKEPRQLEPLFTFQDKGTNIEVKYEE